MGRPKSFICLHQMIRWVPYSKVNLSVSFLLPLISRFFTYFTLLHNRGQQGNYFDIKLDSVIIKCSLRAGYILIRNKDGYYDERSFGAFLGKIHL